MIRADVNLAGPSGPPRQLRRRLEEPRGSSESVRSIDTMSTRHPNFKEKYLESTVFLIWPGLPHRGDEGDGGRYVTGKTRQSLDPSRREGDATRVCEGGGEAGRRLKVDPVSHAGRARIIGAHHDRSPIDGVSPSRVRRAASSGAAAGLFRRGFAIRPDPGPARPGDRPLPARPPDQYPIAQPSLRGSEPPIRMPRSRSMRIAW
jgi:hypothetical protein